ncbi:hypothetical protein KIN20_031132 [Parelaphostrongylus tenuis]|uniref:Uncharacterized protein n=1 Tax=Parelaphostrongylus tenuis TaxID=148309 RepID=A0AAD5WH04_PARTN|nr:hypothetical protein KIN20_031132 [Parelaphostrongylus tenuis]
MSGGVSRLWGKDIWPSNWPDPTQCTALCDSHWRTKFETALTHVWTDITVENVSENRRNASTKLRSLELVCQIIERRPFLSLGPTMVAVIIIIITLLLAIT